MAIITHLHSLKTWSNIHLELWSPDDVFGTGQLVCSGLIQAFSSCVLLLEMTLMRVEFVSQKTKIMS